MNAFSIQTCGGVLGDGPVVEVTAGGQCPYTVILSRLETQALEVLNQLTVGGINRCLNLVGGIFQ